MIFILSCPTIHGIFYCILHGKHLEGFYFGKDTNFVIILHMGHFSSLSSLPTELVGASTVFFSGVVFFIQLWCLRDVLFLSLALFFGGGISIYSSAELYN